MCALAKRVMWTALLFSCLSYGFGTHEALCAAPDTKEPRAKEPAATKPTAKELVEKLRVAQEPLKRSITKSEEYTQWFSDYRNSPKMKRYSGESDMHTLTEMCYDGRRYAVRMRRWGNIPGRENEILESNPACNTWLWDGTRFYKLTYMLSGPLEENTVTIEAGAQSLEKQIGVGDLRGQYSGANETVEAVLAGARSLKLRDKPERIGESDCFVLEADTKYGRYLVWVDPAHGYNVAKAEVSQRKGDVAGLKDTPLPAGMTVHEVIDKVRFAEVDGVWVPMECDIRTELKSADGTSRSVTHHKRTEVKLKPDFEALRSFLPDDIKEGATAFVIHADAPRGTPLDRYIWHNGKPVPVDSEAPRKGRSK